MTGCVLLLGSTDVTYAVARAILEQGVSLSGIVSVGAQFPISYSKTLVKNQRAADLQSLAQDIGVPYVQFESYDAVSEALITASDLCLVAGWYHMVPKSFRTRFSRGCLGFHSSLLPQLRGGAPLNWAIISSLEETGVTLFELSDGVDDGLVYGVQEFTIEPRDSVSNLIDKSRDACRTLIAEGLIDILSGVRTGQPQIGIPTYCLQRTPEDGCIDWYKSAYTVDRLIRAAGQPYAGAYTYLEGTKITLWQASLFEGPTVMGAAGQIARVPETTLPLVVTGQGTVSIERAETDDGSDVLPLLKRSSHKRLTPS